MRIGRCAAALLAVALLAACGGRREERRPFVYFSNFQRTFNDMNGKHLAAARELGIEPLASAEEVGDASRRLRRVESCRWYEVDKLTHSVPYLVDEAEELLETIGENFRDSLESKGYVVREPDPNDRRRVIARCTEAGREHAHDHSSGGVSNLAKTLSGMGEHDVRELLRALETAYSLTYNKDNILGGRDEK